jgi:glycosyltransferase involved in cell wall biosynthesis
VGVQRALSLAKYLPEYGFQVHVLKAANAASPVSDPGLLRQIPASVTVHSAFTPELPFAVRQRIWSWFSSGAGRNGVAVKAPAGRHGWKHAALNWGRRLLAPEPEVLWVPFALHAARKIVRQCCIDAVLVTAPPFSAFLVGNTLKTEFPNLKLISDFRDDWLRFYVGVFDYQSSDYVKRRAAAIERQTIECSDSVVVVTSTMLDHIRARYPDQQSQKFAFIPNGYDPDTFKGVQPRPRQRDKVVITHVGTVYSASSPRYYLDGLDQMPEEVRDHVETRFVGRIAEAEQCHLRSRKSAVHLMGFMPQQKAIEEMAEADYLLLTMTDGPSLTGKIFEYLAVGKPILAITPLDGEVARILQETGSGRYAAPNDQAGICAMLAAAYEQSRTGRFSFRPDWDVIRRFERPRLAGQFGQLLQPEGRL